MKRAGKDAASAEPLDDQEQVAVIKQLLREAQTIGDGARRKFHLMFSVIAGIFCLCICMTMIMPWHIDHQSALRHAVRGEIFVFQLFYVTCAMCSIVSARVVKFGVANFSKVYFFVALLAAVLCGVFWGYVFVTEGVSNPWLLWLPSVSLLELLLAVYIDRDAIALIEEAEQMKSRRYDYKKV